MSKKVVADPKAIASSQSRLFRPRVGNLKRLQIGFGTLCPPIRQQLENQEIWLPEKDCSKFEKDRKAILDLELGGMLSEPVANKFFQRLVTRIAARCEKDGWQ